MISSGPWSPISYLAKVTTMLFMTAMMVSVETSGGVYDLGGGGDDLLERLSGDLWTLGLRELFPRRYRRRHADRCDTG